jgi:zinc protease
MIQNFRTALVSAVSLVLAFGGPLACSHLQPAPAATASAGWGPGPVVFPHPRGVWTQSYSDIAPDPAIRFGTLPNGMRYALMKNATPSGQASLRLRFDAGSLMERDDQQGLAHFLEHMAFNGSKAVPEGDMVKILERLGLGFGADTNAFTGMSETVYQLDLPRTDDETVDTALRLFRETASELLIAQDAVDRERGVVLSEERSRDEPSYRIYQAELKFLLGEQNLVARRMPIGKPDILRSAGRNLIADYYRDYYRPERATLVFVGDFDPAKMEEKIKARFSDWTASGAGGADPALTLPVRRGPEARVAVEPGVPLSVSISWIAPPDLAPDTVADRAKNLTKSVAFAVLNRRLDRLIRAAEPPFISASAYNYGLEHSAEVTNLDLQTTQSGWREGLTAAILDQRRAAQYGVTQTEIDREVDGIRAGLKASVASAATRRTPALADAIVGTVDGGLVMTSPAQALEMFEAAAPGLTPAKVSAALAGAFAGSGPLVFLSTPTPIEGGEAAVQRALNAAVAQAVTAGADLAVKPWPYDNFGAPGAVAERRDVSDLAATFVRFANGVRLTVKPTRFREDQILVTVRIGAGKMEMPKDRITASWTLPTTFSEGGLEALTTEEVEDIMRSRIVGADFSVDEDAFSFTGATRPEDLDIQMELLTASAVKPGWRTDAAYQRVKAYYATIHDQQDATADGVLGRELSRLVHGGDARWAFPSRQDVASGSPADVRALLERPLSGGPIEVVIVGDITVDRAIEATARTFGALPARPAAGWTAPGEQTVAFPAPNATPVVLRHKGRADQAIGVVAWKTDDYFADIHKGRTLRMLGNVLQLRLTDELRERQGSTYSPGVSFSASTLFKGYGFGYATIETTPEHLAGFFTDVERVVADLRDKPVDKDELDRARQPALEAMQKNFESNDFWLFQLSGAQTDERRLIAIRTAISGITRITAADIQAAAREYLKPNSAWRLMVVQEGVTPPALPGQ